MKATKTPDTSIEVSPSQKKLKQARLPFKLISDVPRSPETPQPRKKKLSVHNVEEDDDKKARAPLKVISDVSPTPDTPQTRKRNVSVHIVEKNDDKQTRLPLKVISDVSHTPEMPQARKRKSSVHIIEEDDNKQSHLPSKVISDVPCTPERPRTGKRKLSATNDKEDDKQATRQLKEISDIPDTAGTTTPQTRKRKLSPQNDGDHNEVASKVQKKFGSAKKKEEREKERQERELKRQQEKEEREKVKKEKEDQKKKEREEKEEAKRRDKEEKEEQRRKEREEKERQKELEKKLKEDKEELKRKEKEYKEEQRKKEKEAKEEEKRKKNEALELEKQEQELKKKKAAEAFANFFVPKQKIDKDQSVGPVIQNNMLSNFTIKSDMRLAPTVRIELPEEKKKALESMMESQNFSDKELYVKNLKNGHLKPKSFGKTWPLSDKNDDDVILVEDELQPLDGVGEIVCESTVREKLHPKLFSFHENRRPPYWGTWRKQSKDVRPRRPFGQDKAIEYTVDSDEEWEEEQEGESIGGSAAGSDLDENDEYELDNDVFVPHGYLSDEEATMEEGDVLTLSPETQQARLKLLEDEFETEMKKPTEKLKPRLFGPIWEASDGGKPEKCVDALWNYFGKLAMIMDDPTSLLQPAPVTEETEKKKTKKRKSDKITAEGETVADSPKSEKKKKLNPEDKSNKKTKVKKDNTKISTPEAKKSQMGINTFLKKRNEST